MAWNQEPAGGAYATGSREEATYSAAVLSSTLCGGGVTELLTPLSLMNAIGIETDWHSPGFFGCTKVLPNTLQGESMEFFGR